MSDDLKTKAAEEAMDVAEASRETEWEKPSFVGDLFLGKFNLGLIDPTVAFMLTVDDDRFICWPIRL